MLRALVAMRRDLDLLNPKPAATESLMERRIQIGRPVSQDAILTECPASRIDARAAIQPVVAAFGQSLRSIINIQRDNIVTHRFSS